MPVAVNPEELLKTRLSRFTRALHDLEKGDSGALHRARVASRRLRELVPVLPLDGDTARKLSRRLRRVTRRLGDVRELDVLALLIEELQVSRPAHHSALRRVSTAVTKERDEARKDLDDRLPLEKRWRIARKLERCKRKRQQHEKKSARARRARAGAWSLEARVANRAGRFASAIDDAGAVYLPERLHEVRLSLKKLRYAVELATEAGLMPGKRATLTTLRRGQTLLGRMHDLQILIDRVRAVQASLTPPNVAVWRELDALVTTLDEACRRLHARYVRERDALQAVAQKLAVAPRPLAAARGERRAG